MAGIKNVKNVFYSYLYSPEFKYTVNHLNKYRSYC